MHGYGSLVFLIFLLHGYDICYLCLTPYYYLSVICKEELAIVLHLRSHNIGTVFGFDKSGLV